MALDIMVSKKPYNHKIFKSALDRLYHLPSYFPPKTNQFQLEEKVCAIFVPTPLEGGGELYTQPGFFVQSVLADRYINRRELRLVSLESLSSVEYENKKILLIFF